MSIYFSESKLFEYLKHKEFCHIKIDDKHKRVSFYINDKIFAVLTKIHNTEMLTLHFSPQLSYQLQTSHRYIIPSFDYLKAEHWTTIITGVINDKLLFQLVDLSYNLTITKMTKREKMQIKQQIQESPKVLSFPEEIFA